MYHLLKYRKNYLSYYKIISIIPEGIKENNNF